MKIVHLPTHMYIARLFVSFHSHLQVLVIHQTAMSGGALSSVSLHMLLTMLIAHTAFALVGLVLSVKKCLYS